MSEITLLNMDCMDFMRDLPDDAYELAIVDPPYGIGIDFSRYNNINKIQRKVSNWDSSIPDDSYFNELFRVSKNQVIWGGEYFRLPISSHWVAWDKRTTEAADKIYGGQFELAWASQNGHKMIRLQHAAAINADGAGVERIHPTQKPVKLYEWLLTNYAKPGDRILDTHLGSGSSAIAAHNLGFDFVGIELDKDYFEAAKQRLENHQKQPRMFEMPVEKEEVEQGSLI